MTIEPDDRSEIAALLTECRDLLRALDDRSRRAESGLTRIMPAITDALRRAMLNPRVRKMIGDK